MADVEWIKLSTSLFSNRKIRYIETLPDGYSVIIAWIKLLCLAGSINDSGMVYFTKGISYTDQMLASEFNMPLTTVQLALRTFEQFGMIEIVDNILLISNWEKYQSADKMEQIKEQNRLRKQREREKKQLLSRNVTNVSRDVSRDVSRNVTQQNKNKNKNKDKEKENKSNDLFIEGEEEEEKEKEKEKENVSDSFLPPCPHEEIIDLFNSICRSSPPVVEISEDKVTALDRLWSCISEPSIDVFRACFEKVAETPFLCGNNDKGWKVTFGWIVQPGNFRKVMVGKYDSYEKKKTQNEIMKEMVEELENEENGSSENAYGDYVCVSTARDIQEQG